MLTSKPERPKFIVIHDYNETPGECLPGEETTNIILDFCGNRYRVPWGPTHLILVDFLCRNRYCAHDAIWIANHMQLDPYVTYHGTNAPGHIGRPARTTRTAVRQQIHRIRETLAALIEEEGLDLDAWDLIRSEETRTNVVCYRINADVSWHHRPQAAEDASIERQISADPMNFASGGFPQTIRSLGVNLDQA